MVDDLDESDEINACSIEADGRRSTARPSSGSYSSKMRPTTIRLRSSRSAAATCLGGAIRDPLSGRAYVYQAMRVTGSGDPTVPFKDTMKGKLPTEKDYHRRCGGLFLLRQPDRPLRPVRSRSFTTRVMLQSAWRSARSSAPPKANVKRSESEARRYHCAARWRNGPRRLRRRNGLLQEAQTLESIEASGAEVQKGNPPTERKIQRLFRRPGGFHAHQALQRLWRGRRFRRHRRALHSLEIHLEQSPEEVRRPRRHRACDFRIAGAYGGRARPEGWRNSALRRRRKPRRTKVVAIVTEEPRLKMEYRGDHIVDLSRAPSSIRTVDAERRRVHQRTG